MVTLSRTSIFINLGAFFILAILATMTGCATPAKKACLQIDWQRMGYMDASQGKLAENSRSQRETCITEGVTPDMALFEQGRRQGLEKYCTADNGLALGAKGDLYHGVCPPELRAPFMDAYQKGLQAFAQQLEKDISAMAALQDKMRRELTEVEEDIDYLEREIAEASVGQARLRMGMISEMDMLEANQQSLALQIGALEMDLQAMRTRLSQIKAPDSSLSQ